MSIVNSCVKEHTATIGVNGPFNRLQRTVIAPRHAIDKLTLLLNISHAIQAKSNSPLFNIQLTSHLQEIFLSIHILFRLCINTSNFFNVFSSLQDVITCTYMTCKNKVNKTSVLRLSSI